MKPPRPRRPMPAGPMAVGETVLEIYRPRSIAAGLAPIPVATATWGPQAAPPTWRHARDAVKSTPTEPSA